MSLSALFLWPSAAPLLLIAPLVWVVLIARDRARARHLLAAVGARTPALAGELDAGRRRLARALGASGLLLAILAVLQPLWGEGSYEVSPRGVDMVVCLDVSRSMLARDVAPSRLIAARRDIRAFAEHARVDRMALVVFAGEGRVTAPLTQDLDSFAELVDLADPLMVERGGTDLGAALDAALGALEGASGDHEAVLLVTDGEDLEQRGLRAAEHCKAKNVIVHAIGFGSPSGSKISVEGEQGEVFLRSRSGQDVVTSLDPDGLRKIAETTGGDYVEGGGASSALIALYDRRIVPMARKSFEDRANRERANRYQWPLLLALALWITELAWSQRRRR